MTVEKSRNDSGNIRTRLSRRGFLGGLSAVVGATGLKAATLTSDKAVGTRAALAGLPVPKGRTLRVLPVLMYSLEQPREKTSWRSYGGLATESDVVAEIGRIGAELGTLVDDAEFPIELRTLAKVRNENEAKRLPRAIQEYMRHRFILLSEYLELLRCFEYDDQVNGKRVRRIKIFSPNKAREKKLLVKTRQDLEQHPELLFYEGYIDSQGKVYVADRRAPSSRVKAANT